ncbi:hypothetical protein GCK32_002888 [Trichostrongylus colubriformis]|uniref:Uncharacterized protein n=1 Tax=Trichostrongylus colubriformis TaxID=6319 RepID=A0AAN8EU78_TRICO
MLLTYIILWFYVSTAYFSFVEAVACYTLDLSGPDTAGTIQEGDINRGVEYSCCNLELKFSSFHEHYYVESYRYYGDLC